MMLGNVYISRTVFFFYLFSNAQEWGRVHQRLKKSFIKWQRDLSKETKLELERGLFLHERTPPTIDDFFDTLSKSWLGVRDVYVRARQVIGFKVNKRENRRGRRDEKDKRPRDESKSRSRSRHREPSNNRGGKKNKPINAASI